VAPTEEVSRNKKRTKAAYKKTPRKLNEDQPWALWLGGWTVGPWPCLACLKLSLTQLLKINIRGYRGLCWALRANGSINSLRSTWTSQLPQLSPVQWAFGAKDSHGLAGEQLCSSFSFRTSWKPLIMRKEYLLVHRCVSQWHAHCGAIGVFIHFQVFECEGADDAQTDTDRHSVLTLAFPFVRRAKDTRILTILNSGDEEKSQFGGLSVQGHETRNKKCTQVTPSHHGRRTQVCSALESISKVCLIP
jgi:hypothetical protein